MSIGKSIFEIEMLEIKELFFHHPEYLCLMIVFEGEMAYAEEGKEETILRSNDVLLLNGGETCHLRGNGQNVVFFLKISYSSIEQYLGRAWHPTFRFFSNFDACGRERGKEKLCETLLKLITSLYYDEKKEDDNLFSAGQHIFRLLYLLLNHCLVSRETWSMPEIHCSDGQIHRILSEIEKNYHQDIQLNDLAKKEYVSASYLSRRFKAVTGMGFSQYLNRYRLNKAAQELIVSDSSVSKIAMNCGFSTISNFNKQFKSEFGLTPKEHISLYRQNTGASPGTGCADDFCRLSPEEETHCISRFLINFNSEITLSERSVDIRVFAAEGEQRENLEFIVNVGDANNLLQSIVQHQVEQLLQTVKIQYLRMYGFFQEDYQEDFRFSPTLSMLNNTLGMKFMAQNRLVPIIVLSVEELDQNPDQLSFALNVLRHYSFQFDFPEILIEMELSESQDKNQRVLPCFRRFSNLKVGTGLSILEWKRQRQDLPGDFLCVRANTEAEMDMLYECLGEMKQEWKVLSDRKIFVTNWNIGRKKKSVPIAHYSLRSGELAEAIKRLYEDADAVAIWLNHQINTTSNRDAFRILSVYHIWDAKRPIFYTLMFWEQLRIQNGLVQSGKNYILNAGKNRVSILLYNNFLQDEWLEGQEQLIFNAISLNITVLGLEPGFYMCKEMTLESTDTIRKMLNTMERESHEKHTASAAQWQDMPMTPTDMDVTRYLEHTITPKTNVRNLHIEGKFSSTYHLKSNDCILVILYRLP